MGTKNNPGRFDCYAAAAPDEPHFTLLGRDRDAAVTILFWAALRRLRNDPADAERIAEAEQCATEMIRWLVEHKGREPSGMLAASHALAVMAELNGAVVTVDQEPLLPLAAGNYRHRVSVRHRRSVWGDTPPVIQMGDLL